MIHPSSTNSDQFGRLEDLFFELVSLPECRRDAFLAESCGENPAVRSTLEAMLRADREQRGLIDTAPWSARQVERRMIGAELIDPLARPGAQVGPYTLLDFVASGGMGTVWRARRTDKRPDRIVAIKLLRLGLDEQETLRRFRVEEQVLARLEHPHIARLYDGGITRQGRPYLVMEYVEGAPIDEFARKAALPIDARLRLFQVVCEAVQFAHNALVLHRDLKPSNILVAEGGTPKLLDFGIAKLLGDSGEAGAGVTATDLRVLTPQYASPEQIRGEPLTTASDVYSLGVVLYELLSGHSPYGLRPRTRRDIEQAVLGEIPPPPSESVLRSASAPGSNGRSLARQLRGELDVIACKALAKSPAERYASAEQLAEDIRRHREGLPIVARSAGPVVRLVRVLRRHRRGVTTALLASACAVVISAAALTWWFMAPQWAEERVREARAYFLTPELSNAIWALTFNTSDKAVRRERAPSGSPAVADRAIASYDAALWLDPARTAIQIERDVVALAAASLRPGTIPAIPQGLRRVAPVTCRYAVDWVATGVIPDLADEELDRADQVDLRCLGLFAVLCGETRDSLRAWSRLEDITPDPLVESLLGVLLLAQDQPQRAFPRLLSAYREYPELGFLCTYLADAALAVGDVSLAGRLLDRAATLDHLDPLDALRRVRIKHLLATGQNEAAERLFAKETNQVNLVTQVQFARHVFDSGQRRRAISILNEQCCGSPSYRLVPERVLRAYIELTQRWWADLDEAGRAATLEQVFSESPENLDSLIRILDTYLICQERAVRYHREQALDTTAVPLADDSLLHAPAHQQLVGLCARLDIRTAHRWMQFRNYPPELRAKQLAAWRSAPDPAALSRDIDRAYEVWRTRQSPNTAPAHVKLLPDELERSFGAVVGVDGQLAMVMSTELAIYRLAGSRWEREPLTWPQGTRPIDAALDGGRILALLEARGGASQPSRRAVVFTRAPEASRWEVTSELPIPIGSDTPRFVCLSGGRACIASSQADSSRGPIALYSQASASDATWTREQEIIPSEPALRMPNARPGLSGDTLAWHSGWVDCMGVTSCGNTLLIYHYARESGWRLELEETSPSSLGPRALWTSVACAEGVVIATASGVDARQAAAPVWRRSHEGKWTQEADLRKLIPVSDSDQLGGYVASDGRFAAIALARHAGVRGFHLFQHEDRGWRHVARIDSLDTAFSDLISAPALSGDLMIIGAPGHDAAGLDRGAAYILEVGRPQNAKQ